MALTLANLRSVLKHALGGGDPAVVLSTADATSNQWINEAGRHLCMAHPWPWLQRPPARLASLAIDFTGATWTNGTLTITKTSAFSSYTRREGDYVDITSGTGATAGRYYVASSTANTLVLTSTIGASADGQTNIAGGLRQPSLSLPSDFGKITSVRCHPNVGVEVRLTSLDDLNKKRADGMVSGGNTVYAAIVFPSQTSATVAPGVARLDVFPAPETTIDPYLSLFYHAGWTTLSSDTDVANVPVEIEPLLVAYVRAIARGYELDAGVSAMAEVDQSTLFWSTVRHYGLVQSEMGRIENGHLSTAMQSRGPYMTPGLIQGP